MKSVTGKHSITTRIIGILLLLAVFVMGGCGGGTTGSGLTTFEGRILTQTGAPVANATITDIATGEFAITDAEGFFRIESSAGGSQVQFLVETATFSTTVTLQDIASEEARITVDLRVNPDNTVDVSRFTMKVSVVGLCTNRFNEGAVIKQAKEIPVGQICTLKVKTFEEGKPAGAVPFALQFSSCEKNAVWETLLIAQTGIGNRRGVGQVSFSYFDSPEFCHYRITAPFGVQRRRPLSYAIETLTAHGK